MPKLLTREMTDIERDKLVQSETYRQVIAVRRAIREALQGEGYTTGRITRSGNIDCAWIIEARRPDGHYINVEIAGGPWEGALDSSW